MRHGRLGFYAIASGHYTWRLKINRVMLEVYFGTDYEHVISAPSRRVGHPWREKKLTKELLMCK